MKQNITQYWRQHFVLEESMLEVTLSGSCCLPLNYTMTLQCKSLAYNAAG